MIISNSDIQSFQKCEKRFYFERLLELRPREYPPAMEVGTFGHKMMEAGFEVILAGGTYEEACHAAGQLLMGELKNPERMKVYKHVVAFIAYFLDQPWRVVAIEEKGNSPISDEIEFGFTPDLIIEFTRGPLKGQLAILDYKFTGQYWTDREINMAQQIPKYMVYKNLRDGTNIRRGAVVMLNTRAADSAKGQQLFLVKWINPSQQRLQEIQRENEILLNRVKPYYELGPEDSDKFMRTVDIKQCKMCFFADDLCPADFDGKDTSRIIKHNYIINDYGYNKDEINVPNTD